MKPDRNSYTLSFKKILQQIGKPFYFFLIISISFIYSLILIVQHFFIQLNKHSSLINLHVSQRSKNGVHLYKTSIQKSRSLVTRSFIVFILAIKTFFQQSFIKVSRFLSSTSSKVQSLFSSALHRIHSITTPRISITSPTLPALPAVNFPPIKPPPLDLRLPTIKLNYIKLLFLLFLFGAAYSSYQYIFKDPPHPKDLLHLQPPVTTKIFDRHHRPLYEIYKDENRSIITLAQVPQHVINATLAIEDSDFYQHPGFSVRGIIRAFKKNVTEDRLQGGSTITQQLVKNTLLTSEKTLLRKIKEVIIAISVESYFTKDEILTMYLNEVGYGGTAYGIEAASQTYFNKSVDQLNLAEAALIAGLPAAPTTFSPFGANPELSRSRQHEVLRRMTEEGYISQDQANLTYKQSLAYASPSSNIQAPHFVMHVKDLLVNLYGEQKVDQGGLNVTTTIDLDIQELAETIIQQELETLTQLHINNSAVIITSPKTGEVLAMVGSKDYFDTQNDGQVNVTTRPRQPGSSIKPVNYAFALENGYTPATIINDSPIVYNIKVSNTSSFKTYAGRFHGRVTLRQALANSYNVPAVKTLNHFGVPSMITTGQQLGISTWNDSSRFGLALTLGGGEVTLADLAIVYGTFANLGEKIPLQPLLSVTDYTNHNYPISTCSKDSTQLALTNQAHAITEPIDCQKQAVLSPATSFLISDILSDNQARSSAFGTNSVLHIPEHQVAVKTGTTNSMRDNWTIGYTNDYVVAVWVGNNDNSPMSYVASGITGASPIWSKIMTALLKDLPSQHFDPPPTIIETSICPHTNSFNCTGCPNPQMEYFVRGTEPKTTCNPEQFTDPNHPQFKNFPRDQILDGISTN